MSLVKVKKETFDGKVVESSEKKKRIITDDDLYRNSTQFRLWSFTEAQLNERRAKVNIKGKQKTLKKLKLLCEKEDNTYSFESLKNLLQTVSEEDELKEISYYVGVLQKLSTSVLKLPSQVRATAIAFLKRFYLIHSAMEYHPKKVLSTCLFLAAKSENCFMSPKTLAEFLGSKTTPESILELEFELIQSLSFTLLCHHPFRPLHGFFFDFQSVLIHKHPNGVVVIRKDEKTNEKKKLRVKFPNERIMKAYISAREYIDHSLISDAAFLYTPPQIALACFLKVDEEMTTAYLTYKFVKDQKKKNDDEEPNEEKIETEKTSSAVDNKEDSIDKSKEDDENKKQDNIAFYKKLIKTLKNCLKTIETIQNPSLDEAKSIDKKVHYCINPDKLLKKKRQESPDSNIGGDVKRVKTE